MYVLLLPLNDRKYHYSDLSCTWFMIPAFKSDYDKLREDRELCGVFEVDANESTMNKFMKLMAVDFRLNLSIEVLDTNELTTNQFVKLMAVEFRLNLSIKVLDANGLTMNQFVKLMAVEFGLNLSIKILDANVLTMNKFEKLMAV
jgi:hypothetical protein